VKLLEVVWNYPDTVAHPFDMYYFYWPVHEAALRGWDVEVLTFQVSADQSPRALIDGVPVRRVPGRGRRGKPFSWPFIRALVTTDADIIHCHGYAEGRSELAILLAWLRGRAVVFTPHFHVFPYRRPVREFYDRTIGRFFFHLSDRVIVFTQYTYQHLLALGMRPERLRIVPHVSRPEVFAETAGELPAGALVRAAGVTGDPLILAVGQLIPRKGFEYTLRCLPAIVARFPRAKLLIIGPSQPADPAFRQHLSQLATALHVDRHVQVLQDNSAEFIRDAYRSATILTHPSLVESFGLVLLEAMTAGVPIVAHNGTGIPSTVDDGVTGYVVDVRDREHYTAVLLALLEDSALRQRMGAHGRMQAETRFGQRGAAEALFAVYAEVLDGRHRAGSASTGRASAGHAACQSSSDNVEGLAEKTLWRHEHT
jgi:glycosyltransferase involved in cell wall biosynthesis